MSQVNSKIIEIYDINLIEELFDQLPKKYEYHTPFLSKAWLCNWLRTTNHKPLLVTVTCNKNNELKGFAFFGVVSSCFGKTLYLNQTGEHTQDQIWIEHNDIICLREERTLLLDSMLTELSRIPRLSRIFIRTSLSNEWQNSCFLEPNIEEEKNWFVDLKEKTTYETTISKNCRSSIRRSNRLIEDKFGNIMISIDKEIELPEILLKIAKLNQKRWDKSDYGSGFSNPKFVEFHQQLMSTAGGPEGANVKVLTITAGEFTLGYLYMLTMKKDALFYLSAINYVDLGNQFKPGLSLHFAAINLLSELGFERYDFLAGYARYKESMANNVYSVYHIELYSKSIISRIRKKLHKIKTYFNKT
jgi:hypothetical protein